MRYDSMYERLVANTAEPENDRACWTWTGPTRRHGGGDRPAVCVRLEQGPRQRNGARVMLDELGDLQEGHEASHLCKDNWLCIHPDHLVSETKQDNLRRRDGHAVPLPRMPHADPGDWWVGKRGGRKCPF